jgi:hypothetical protein
MSRAALYRRRRDHLGDTAVPVADVIGAVLGRVATEAARIAGGAPRFGDRRGDRAAATRCGRRPHATDDTWSG